MLILMLCLHRVSGVEGEIRVALGREYRVLLSDFTMSMER